MTRLFIVTTLALSLISCGDSGANPHGPDVYEEIRVRIGQEGQVAGGALAIGFNAVLEDSRCAMDALCPWPGNGKIAVSLQLQNEERAGRHLNTFLDPQAVSHGGYAVRLSRLEPPQRVGVEIAPNAYVATFVVTNARE